MNADLHPVGQPRAVGTVAVGIVSAPGRTLAIVGLNPATGRKLWQQPITPSAVTPGVRVEFTPVGKNKIAYFRPAGPDLEHAEFVLGDAATGDDVTKTPQALFSSMPYLCASDHDVCATARTSDAGTQVVYRLEVATGQYVVEGEPLPPHARSIEGGLFDLGDRPGNTFAFVREGTIQWRVPAGAAFPPGFSTDYGWWWNLFREHEVFVGSVGGPIAFDGSERIRDLASTSATAGLSGSDGKVMWRDDGSAFPCHLGGGHYPVRCRWRGLVRFTDAGDTSFRDVDVTVEGFDVTSGRTTWSVPLGDETSLVAGEVRPPVAGPSEVVLVTATGTVVLDYATGRVSAPTADATFWCLREQRYEFAQPFQSRGAVQYLRPGGVLAQACDQQGRPVGSAPSMAATNAVGAVVGDYVVVASIHGYVGLRLSGGRSGERPASAI